MTLFTSRIFEPLAFRSFRPEECNIREFYEAGVRLMSQLHTGLNCTLDVPYSKFGEIWTGPKQYDYAAFDRQMELFLKHAPDAFFNIMLLLDTREWALKAHLDWSVGESVPPACGWSGHKGGRNQVYLDMRVDWVKRDIDP